MRTTPLALGLLGMACSIGPRASQHPLTAGAAGVSIAVELTALDSNHQHRSVSGELLAVTDTGLWILANTRPTWVRFSVVSRAVFPESGDDDFWGPNPPSQKAHERLRLESRFPQGMTPDLIRRLAGVYGDSTATVIRE